MISLLRRFLADGQSTSVRALLIQCGATVLLMGAVNQAVAACGDYVMVGGEHSANHATRHRGRVPGLPSAHCDGPNCQRQVPPPVDPSRQVLNTPSTDAAFVAAIVDIPSSSRTSTSLSAPLRPLPGYRLAIEHPPRAFA